MGDYRKGEGLMSDPTEDLTMWVLPPEVARLLCRIIIWGKPIEIRLAHQLFGIEAAGLLPLTPNLTPRNPSQA